MPTITNIKKDLLEAEALKLVAGAFSEISSIKLGRIRGQIEKNDLFTAELASLYHLVQEESLKRQLLQPQTKGVKRPIFSWKKPGTVSIVLTANSRFYGGLENSLLHYFIAGTEKISQKAPHNPHIRVVIGKTGSSYLQGIGFKSPYQPVIFKKDLPTEIELTQIVNQFKNYETVLVFHSKFRSVLNQIPAVTDVSQSPKVITTQRNLNKQASFHVFEPEINQIIEFFSSQILKILLQQTFLEAELSRTAYRLVAMDEAQSNASNYIKQQRKILALAKKSIDNVRLLETIASYKQWGDQSND